MLTIQPKLLNSHKQQSFTRSMGPMEYTTFEEIGSGDGGYDLVRIQRDAKLEAKEWEAARNDLNVIAEKTENVPVLNKGVKFLSSLIPVAIGWGGLRWGAAGTLQVLSKFGKTKPVQALGRFAKKGVKLAGRLFQKGKTALKGTKLYENAGNKFTQVKAGALDTKAGKKLSTFWNNLKGKNAFNKFVGWKNDFVARVKKLSPKQIFVETMGLAGGATAAVQQLGGNVVDGAKQDVSADGRVNGVPLYEECNNAA